MEDNYKYGFNRGYEAGYRAAYEKTRQEVLMLQERYELLVKHVATLDYLQPRVIVLEQK